MATDNNATAAAVAQWIILFAPQAERWLLDPSRDRPKSLKTGSDSSTAKHSAFGVSVTGPRG